ncbi:hypothetical protein O181_116425 [Austropuccinia psidii MF-1]|uniref:Integrase catalytic domain-containing protein n=1 Tax=Austropuccinia psidii MF-1 TaxID=1389203 RepID=A0A9Q3PXE3_9BASI|nr:hypothetical protein [Austropuccinia psidii MF-1]
MGSGSYGWLTALPPGGDKHYNACLVISDRHKTAHIFLPCHKEDIAIDTALLILNRVITHACLFQNFISDRDPKFTSALWTNLHKPLGTKLSFSTEYHPQTDGLAERMIQKLEDIIRRFCAYGLEFKDSDGFTHNLCTLIPALESAYKTSIHSSKGKTPAMLEKGWNPKIPVDTLKKYLVDIYPTASIFKLLLVKVRHHAKQSMNDAFAGKRTLKLGPILIMSCHPWDSNNKTHRIPRDKTLLFLVFLANKLQAQVAPDVSLLLPPFVEPSQRNEPPIAGPSQASESHEDALTREPEPEVAPTRSKEEAFACIATPASSPHSHNEARQEFTDL